jgi:hypothetical protein
VACATSAARYRSVDLLPTDLRDGYRAIPRRVDGVLPSAG